MILIAILICVLFFIVLSFLNDNDESSVDKKSINQDTAVDIYWKDEIVNEKKTLNEKEEEKDSNNSFFYKIFHNIFYNILLNAPLVLIVFENIDRTWAFYLILIALAFFLVINYKARSIKLQLIILILTPVVFCISAMDRKWDWELFFVYLFIMFFILSFEIIIKYMNK